MTETNFIENINLPEGFRLDHLELYNWGTFHNRIWTVNLNCQNTLLTGENGSGKSTAADALLALLSPYRNPHYNEAAGASAGERTLYTYVVGFYKKTGVGDDTEYLCLRKKNHFTVILAVFTDQKRSASVTLARVLWPQGNSKQVDGFCVIADEALTIKDHFSNFGSDIKALKKRLAKVYTVHETYSSYVADFKRALGIGTNQALELFCEAVGTKQVPNLSSFVKEHMIPPADFNAKASNILEQFNDLTKIYEEMEKAKEQIIDLTPIVNAGEKYALLVEEVKIYDECYKLAHTYLATYWADVIKGIIDTETLKKDNLDAELEQVSNFIKSCKVQIDKFVESIYQKGGGRLEAIDRDLKENQERLKTIKTVRDLFANLVTNLGEEVPNTISEFTRLRSKLSRHKEEFQEEKARLEDDRSSIDAPYYKLEATYESLKAEFASLEHRQSNLPLEQIRIRETLCQALNIPTEELPFVGELIEVEDAYKEKWQGAIERVLYGFALSMLVKPQYYDEIVKFVNSSNLRGRLVYYRVEPAKDRFDGFMSPKSLVKRVKVKDNDRVFYDFVFANLLRRFNYVCTDDLLEFKRERMALTSRGMTKSPGGRHEKDDRHNIDDRTRYVLGWSNVEKRQSLQKLLLKTEQELALLMQKRKEARNRIDVINNSIIAVNRLLEYQQFSQIDLTPFELEIEKLNKQKEELLASDSGKELESLKKRKDYIEGEIEKSSLQRDRLINDNGKLEEKINQLKAELQSARQVASEKGIGEDHKAKLNEFFVEATQKKKADFKHRDDFDRAFTNLIVNKRQEINTQISALSSNVISAATTFVNRYPDATRDINPKDVLVYKELKQMLDSLENDNLPKFIESFKQKLRDQTIYSIGNLASSLKEEEKSIKRHIDDINSSLAKLDYNPGTYILIKPRKSNDREIIEFQEDLKNCTSFTFKDNEFDEEQAREKFLEIKKLLDRFAGRDGKASIDKTWREKVLDVRNWLIFGAEELYRFDNQEKEYFDGSDGKSGGQKEKLAYTILAAAIAYQYRLAVQDNNRSFRFVMIDEAFCRGSDDTARHTLSVFKMLDLQVMVITPLLKLNVIEQFVKTVAYAQMFVDVKHNNLELSAIQNLTVEEYAKDKAAYLEKKEKESNVETKGDSSQEQLKVENPVLGINHQEGSKENSSSQETIVLDESQDIFKEGDGEV